MTPYLNHFWEKKKLVRNKNNFFRDQVSPGTTWYKDDLDGASPHVPQLDTLYHASLAFPFAAYVPVTSGLGPQTCPTARCEL
ncbi:hypothetical protein CCMA1212_007273 [Trichoderma ghanense]|uniref:Uncharacterized protein n=1 Tax=Trichoderma ghanense TaxID=65468 RepID=A0ABY2GXZ6_9HYPO